MLEKESEVVGFASGSSDPGGSDLATDTVVSIEPDQPPQTTEVIEIEEEDDGIWGRELAEEENRLRKEREEREEKENPGNVEGEVLLKDSKMGELDFMLNQTGLYSQFMKEAITKLEDEDQPRETDPQAGDEANGTVCPTGRGSNDGKRKMKGGASEPTKRQKHMGKTPTQELLPLINGDLRDYQLRGVRWLLSLYKNGLHGILADEMGLGKTIQTIGLFAYLREKRILGPFLVIAPLSTLVNWVSEFEKFAPSLPCLLYHGDKSERAKLRATKLSGKITAAFPVIVTTYEIVMNDISFFMKFNFKSMIVDEGHRLKNHKCKLIRHLRAINSANKVLLTGTPLQNTLSELWSILNFILPNVFQRLVDFEAWFDFSAARQDGGDQALIAMEQRNRVVSKLHDILKPFFLRRLKSDVSLKLPQKQEIILYAPMTQHQKDVNLGLLDHSLQEQLNQERLKNCAVCVGSGKLRNLMMQMRKNCNHPDLIEGGYDGSTMYPDTRVLIEQCGKLHLLDRLLKHLRKGGHKVLIFSQENGHDACRIDGSVGWKERQSQIVTFNKQEGPFAFLLSTRAGGLGINLTGADTVIIYDSDWNPQQDLQAMDRCHRIGQTRPVLVLRLITAHSVEVKMIKRASEKMVLERLVMKKGAFKGDMEDDPASMKVEELLALLRNDVMLDDIAQTCAVSDEVLDKILDRTHLVNDTPIPYQKMDYGYEVVIKAQAQDIL